MTNQGASAVEAICEMLKHVAILAFAAFLAYGFYQLILISVGK